jgi:hypothetical protein
MNIQEYFKNFVAKIGASVESTEHNVAKQFAEYVEGEQKIADAVALLTSNGYTVTPPAPPAQ